MCACDILQSTTSVDTEKRRVKHRARKPVEMEAKVTAADLAGEPRDYFYCLRSIFADFS